MDKSQIVVVLERIGIGLELDEVNPFEILAFKNGAEHLADWEGDLENTVASATLTDIYGVGKGLATVITELVTTGRCAKYEDILTRYPETLFDLFRVSGLGGAKIKALNKVLGVDSLSALEEAARAQRVRALPGFGAKSEERILRSLAYLESKEN